MNLGRVNCGKKLPGGEFFAVLARGAVRKGRRLCAAKAASSPLIRTKAAASDEAAAFLLQNTI